MYKPKQNPAAADKRASVERFSVHTLRISQTALKKPGQYAARRKKEGHKTAKAANYALEVAKRKKVDKEKEEKTVEKVQNATNLRQTLLTIWDAVIDLQDEVASALAMLENKMPIPAEQKAWVYRPGEEPVMVNIVDYAREVLGNVAE